MTQGLYQYTNCYGMLEEIRNDVNEYSVELCKGTAKGVYDNSDIVRKINVSQKFIWNLLFQRFPELFLTDSTVTGSGGVYQIPSDLFKLNYIADSNGNKLSRIFSVNRHPVNSSGSAYSYYQKGNTIVRDDGSSDALTFHYFKSMKELTQGYSKGGSSTSIILDTNAKGILSYYVNVIIENVTDGWADTITAYTAARVATVTNRGAANKYYGTVSELPEPFHHLVTGKATLLLKNSMVSGEKATPAQIQDFQMDLIETLKAFTGTYHSDVSMDELFMDLGPYC